ncbi:hypothetical protein [Kitasatospora griseola]|uniref:hypothetical protein n=1 Tax=Kitasatospora griseola TaxID=2064 RepID=UPI0016705B4D|nr:hypothetical protein [Kitasatospora griseola]
MTFGVWGDSDVGAGVIGSSDTPTTDTAHVRPAGVVGVNKATRGVGVEGFCAQGTGVLGIGGADQPGVAGKADTGPGVTGTSSQGVGVTGNGGGMSPGVSGNAAVGPGVSGTSDQGAGVSGNSTSGPGVTGQADTGPGVLGTSTDGTGVTGQGTSRPGVLGTGADAPGVQGISARSPGVAGSSPPGPGVSGISSDGPGVFGDSGHGPGVRGLSALGTGVEGTADPGPAVSGNSLSGTGVLGTSLSGTAVSGTSTSGQALTATTDTGTGAVIQSHDGVAVSASCGHPEPDTGQSIGFSDPPNRGPAVRGQSWFGPGVQGVSVHDAAVDAFGWIGLAASGVTLGADINNGLRVNGVIISAGSARFVIDHPLDPADTTLTHAFVASPEQKNVYDGVVTLDDTGAATVTLPDWFDALNQHFRYQLTPIGAPAPGLHVNAEISGNSFSVAGGPPGGKVSWQVTGVRLDKWARANPVTPVTAKPADQRGRFLHPTAFDQPVERGIGVPPAPVRTNRREEM